MSRARVGFVQEAVGLLRKEPPPAFHRMFPWWRVTANAIGSVPVILGIIWITTGELRHWATIAFFCSLAIILRGITLLKQRMRGYVLERGYSVCLCCGYDLRNLKELRCPECGEQFSHTKLEAQWREYL